MASTPFPRAPRALNGALAVYPDPTPGAQPSRIIAFQYNPDTMRRTLAARSEESPAPSSAAARESVLHVPGPPVETISLSVELDAADQLEKPDAHAAIAEHGLHPALATLEMLLYPNSAAVRDLEELAARGEVQVAPNEVPLVLLVWGRSRVVPVKVTGYSVTEELFDVLLNPVRAKVELALQVLTYVELPAQNIGYDAFRSYQGRKEEMSRLHRTGADAERGVRNLLPGG